MKILRKYIRPHKGLLILALFLALAAQLLNLVECMSLPYMEKIIHK